MPQPLGDEGGDAFEVEWLFFANAEKDCGRAEMLAVEDFVFGGGEIVFGSLGEVGLDVGEDVGGAAAFPCIFTVMRRSIV